jgi:hypothetical protein
VASFNRCEEWVNRCGCAAGLLKLAEAPQLLDRLVKGFGLTLYRDDQAYYKYIYLITGLQGRFPRLRSQLQLSWDLAQSWQSFEPNVHRTPIPEAVALSIIALGLFWGWYRFSDQVAMMFYGIVRPIEPLSAARGDLVLPGDVVMVDKSVAYLHIDKPKAGGRGGARHQYFSVQTSLVIELLECLYAHKERSERLWGLSASLDVAGTQCYRVSRYLSTPTHPAVLEAEEL